MYLAFVDESDHTRKTQFTICGLTAVASNKAAELSETIEKLREASNTFTTTDALKYASSTKPANCPPEQHLEIKNQVIREATAHDAVFFGYAYFNQATKENVPNRNRIFGFNTLLGKFNDFLVEKSANGLVQFDRIDLEGKNKLGFKDSYEYMQQKFQKGNDHSSAKNVPENWKPLSNIISYSMTCDGASHLASMNDILTGSLRYLINGENEGVRLALRDQLKPLMWKNKKGVINESGLTLRPLVKSKLSTKVSAEYEILRSFLNS